MNYLDIVSEIRTGLQSGIDSCAATHAVSRHVRVGGFVPLGKVAEVYRDGTWSDEVGGIPNSLFAAGDFTETSLDNVRAALSGLGSDARSGCSHLLNLAADNPSDFRLRTEMNVVFSEASLIVTTDNPNLRDGTVAMNGMAMRHGKPAFTITIRSGGLIDPTQVVRAREWIVEKRIAVLNVGGVRASHEVHFGLSIGSLAMAIFDLLYGAESHAGS